MKPANKKAIVIFSGGMDSTLCLQIAIKKWSLDQVLALSFDYCQRNHAELEKAKFIANTWGVAHDIIKLDVLEKISDSSLVKPHLPIDFGDKGKKQPPNTMVVGRNGLMVRLAAIYGYNLGVQELYTGVMELEEANSGYRDCSRHYMDLMQEVLKLDLAQEHFAIVTPLIFNSKLQNLELAYEMGILTFMLEHCLSCYEGIGQEGCQACPACELRNEGIAAFEKAHPEVPLPYSILALANMG